MALNLSLPEKRELKPRISVFGVGGAGGNAVNNMIIKELEGVDFVVANTDAQALAQNTATDKIQLGAEMTEGLGAGAKPEVGAGAAEESIEAIVDQLVGSHMCFITAGMGGGTGTGAAPVIAQAARQLGILTVGVVTKPFQFEGQRRMRQAEAGIAELQKHVDTLIIIPNQNLFRLANEQTTFADAFNLADDVLYQGVKGVTDLMIRPGLINLDFADIRSVMEEMGKAMMGTGEAEGEERALHAAERAIANPLLDEISLRGARGVLINITGGTDMTLFELDEAANKIREEVDPDANIIVGSTLDPDMNGKLRVSVVATGIDAEARHAPEPVEKPRAEQPRQDYVEAQTSHNASEPSQPVRAQNDQYDAPVAPRSDNSRFYADPEVEGVVGRVEEPQRQQPAARHEYVREERNFASEQEQRKREILERMANGGRGSANTEHNRAQPSEPTRRSGMNISSLIDKMAPRRHQEAPTPTAQRPSTQVPPRPEPRATQPSEKSDHYRNTSQNDDGEASQRVDIPAFLRRQAN